jgi:hypothetical protein
VNLRVLACLIVCTHYREWPRDPIDAASDDGTAIDGQDESADTGAATAGASDNEDAAAAAGTCTLLEEYNHHYTYCSSY